MSLQQPAFVLKVASAGAVRENPAEAFAKGGNSDEHQENILNPMFLALMIQENPISDYCQRSRDISDFSHKFCDFYHKVNNLLAPAF